MSFRILNINTLDEIKDNKLIIYGAGKYGNFLYALLEVKGLADNVICFAVTNCLNNPETLCEKKVECLDRIKKLLKDCVVILALGEKASGEVLESLQRCAAKGIYRVNRQFIQGIGPELIAGYKKLPLKQNKIILSSYDGMGYRCNCKYIAEKLIQNKAPVELVWLISDNSICDIPEKIKKVVINSPQYYKEVLTAKIYITNTVHSLYEHKREGQFFINTWHGYGPFKLAEGAVNKDAESRERYRKSNAASDLFLTASRFYTQIYRDSFFYEGEVMECGAPRNDIFFTQNTIKTSVYKKLQISFDKKILLYAPTFREDTVVSFQKYDIDMKRVLNALEKRFGGEYVLVYRFHHYLYRLGMPQNFYAGAIDATYYPDIQELLAAADVVITDYSSLMWDFSLQRRPVFLYQNDEKDYENDRGFYSSVSEWPYPKAHTQEELIDIIVNFNKNEYVEKLDAFLKKYGSCDDGHAAERVVERILQEIGDTDGYHIRTK